MTAHPASTVKQNGLSAPRNTDAKPIGEIHDVADQMLVRTLSGVFDESFDLYKRHFKTLALITALMFFPAQIVLHGIYNTWLRPLQAHMQTPSGEPDLTTMLLALTVGLMIGNPEYGLPGVVSLAVLALVSGPLCVAISDITLGRTPSVKESYRRAATSMPHLLVGWTFAGLISFGIAASCAVLAFFVALLTGVAMGAEFGPGVMIVIWFVGLITTYLLTMAVLARIAIFTSPLITLEKLPLLAVYDRNHQLVSRVRFHHTWAAAAALPVVVFGLQYLILFSAYATLSAFHLAPLNEFIVSVALTAAIVLFFQPYLMVVITTLYYDYRVRGEGLDVVLLASNLPAPAPLSIVAVTAPVATMAPTPQQTGGSH